MTIPREPKGCGMTTDTIVTVRDTAVMYVAGETGKPIAEQAPKAFKALEAKPSSLKGRKFYGIVLGNEYRASVDIDPNDDPLSLPHPTWVATRRQIRSPTTPELGKQPPPDWPDL